MKHDAKEGARDLADNAEETYEYAKYKASEYAGKAGDKAHDAKENVKEGAEELADNAEDKYYHAKYKANEYADEVADKANEAKN